jgi:tRNA (adenine22-N1)-methyltransferase
VLIADRLQQTASLNETLYQDRQIADKTIKAERLLAMGPYLLTQAHPIWIQKWEEELNKLHRIIEQLSQSQQEASLHRQKLIQEEMAAIQEVLVCSQKVKPSFK